MDGVGGWMDAAHACKHTYMLYIYIIYTRRFLILNGTSSTNSPLKDGGFESDAISSQFAYKC